MVNSNKDEVWEWRSLSVLFCDLVGSTELIEALEEESYSTILRRYYAICTDAVRAAGGMVAQYQGDGVICQFGWPHASEDDAVRAVRAATVIVDAVGAVSIPGKLLPLAARVGLASGRIKMRAGGGDFGTGAIGAGLHRAARLQTLARPGSVMVCQATRELAGGMFEYRELKDTQLKGFDASESVFRVLRERSEPTSRFEALRGNRSTALVGRESEIAQLAGQLAAARAGTGSFVNVTAPAGYGKSRLIQALRAQPQAAGCRVFVLQCAPEAQGTPLHPVREFVEWAAGALRRHTNEARHQRLQRLFSTVWGVEDPALNDLLDLLSPVGSGNAADENSSVLVRRRRAFSALGAQLFRSAADAGALILIVEDLHWADASTIDFLTHLAGEIAGNPMLVITTTRPEGSSIAGSETIALTPLSTTETAELVRLAVGGRSLGPEALQAVIDRAEGVPLFVEEYADMLSGTPAGHVSSAAARVPLSLDAIVRGRLDDLGQNARALAGAGAAIGRRFDYRAAGVIAGLDLANAESSAADLVGARLAEEITGDERTEIQFSHGLFRDTIYSSMDQKRQRSIHEQIVAYMRGYEPVHLGGDEVLAEHLALAGRYPEAIDAFVSAAMRSTKVGAVTEAIGHIERGLEALQILPDGLNRDALELRIRAIQGPTLMVMRGPGAPAFGAAQQRARDLLNKLDMQAEAVPVIYNSALHAWARGDLATADRLADELDEIQRDSPSDGGFMAAHTMHGLVAWHEGRNSVAKGHFTEVIGRYDAEKHRDLYSAFLKEFGVFAQFYYALTLTVMGDFAEGQAAAQRALDLARHVRRPHAEGFGMLALFNTAMLRNDVAEAEQWAKDALSFATRQGFPEFMAMSQFCLGWVNCQHGNRAEGSFEMDAAAKFWNMTGFISWQPVFAGIAACEAALGGQLDRAHDLIRQFAATPELQATAPLALAQAILAEAEGTSDRAWHYATTAARTAVGQSGWMWLQRIEAAFPGVMAELEGVAG